MAGSTELNRLANSIRGLGFGIKNRVAIAMRDEMNALLEEQFDLGIGPDGEAWEELRPSTRKRGRTPPPLTDTHQMRDHIRAVRIGTNVAIESESPAQFHQSGTSRMARRSIWPDGDELPGRWDNALTYAATRAMSAGIEASDLGRAAE